MTQDDPSTAPASSNVIASVAYVNGLRDAVVPLDQVSAYVNRPDTLLWIGLKDPDAELLAQLGTQLGLGDQVIEEINLKHRRPKIVDFGPLVLAIAITVEVGTERPTFGETQLLIGRGVLVTIRRGAAASHSELRQRLEAAPELLERGSDFIASELLDLMVDRYVQAASKFEHTIETMEQKLLLRGLKDADIRKLYRVRRDLLRIHAVVAPLADACNRLARVAMKPIDPDARPYFAEVADRVVRVDSLVSALRETLAFAFEAGMMIGQAQQTEITKKLAAWAAILAVPTAIAGIYGMNFEFMPELKWAYGYPAVMGAVFTACGVLYWRFRRVGWL